MDQSQEPMPQASTSAGKPPAAGMTPAPGEPPVPDAPPAAPIVPPQPATPAPAAVGWVMPSAPAARGPRSTLAAAAGIVLLVLGVLGALLGLLIVLGGAALGTFGRNGSIPGLEGVDIATAFGGIVAVLGIIVIVYSVLYIAGGIGVINSREWGRWLGMVVAIISGLFWLAAVAGPGDRGGIVFALLLLVAHGYVLFALALRWRAT